jgi:glycolate oxidase iron-sulfur subunit
MAGRQLIELVPLMEEEHCCGSAGIYNLGHPVLSQKILDRKMAMVKSSGVSTIVTTNPGCMLQLESGIKQQGLDIQVLHLASMLSKAYLNSF